MMKSFFLILGLLFLMIVFFRFHGDNRRIVTVQGTVIDSVTGKALDGVGVTNVWWVDRVPPEVEPKVTTVPGGEFSLRLRLRWAFYPYNLVIPSKYQPFELFFMQEGYASRWIDFGKFRVKYFAGPGQEIDVGEITLERSDRREGALSLTVMETL